MQPFDPTDSSNQPAETATSLLLLPGSNESQDEKNFSVQRLNDIQNHLWLAGRQLPPRALNYQIAASRSLVADERSCMHLVWESSRRMHIKPLPRYLWDRAVQITEKATNAEGHPWCASSESHTQPNQVELDARGLLNSYFALIQYESDFEIAKAHYLLPSDMTWVTWDTIAKKFQRVKLAWSSHELSYRYRYGELRLSRLNWIYRLRRGAWIRAYEFEYQTFGELFRAWIAPLTVTTVYIALALSAMQVGLTTNHLANSQTFEHASYGLTVLAIMAPLILLLLLGFVALIILVDAIFRTRRSKHIRDQFYNQLALEKMS